MEINQDQREKLVALVCAYLANYSNHHPDCWMHDVGIWPGTRSLHANEQNEAVIEAFYAGKLHRPCGHADPFEFLVPESHDKWMKNEPWDANPAPYHGFNNTSWIKLPFMD